MDTKPMIQSVTLWINAILPVIYLLVPGVEDVLTTEAALGVLALVNGLIRVFKTDKAIEGVL